jgi:hypothetical protein
VGIRTEGEQFHSCILQTFATHGSPLQSQVIETMR